MTAPRSAEVLASAIDAHLKRLEGDEALNRRPAPVPGAQPMRWLSLAGAEAVGDAVRVHYMGPYGGWLLAPAAAAAYLAALEEGFADVHTRVPGAALTPDPTAPLQTLAARIDAHLSRWQADPTLNGPRRDKTEPDPWLFGAGASVSGRYVRVRYVSYQGAPTLPKGEAAHYLAALDAGFVGRHFELFREAPPSHEAAPAAPVKAKPRPRVAAGPAPAATSSVASRVRIPSSTAPAPDGGPRLTRAEIPRFPQIRYETSVSWNYLEQHIHNAKEDFGLNLDPLFQRAHVWTDAQRTAYIEYVLQGGEVGRNLTFVCMEWDGPGEVVGYAVLDGKQRLETVRRFLRGEVRVFADARRPEGYAIQDIEGGARGCEFLWRVVEVKTPVDVLDLYLKINAGGTSHNSEELDRVRALRARLAADPSVTLATLAGASL